ncbi:MAG: zinc-ribbon and DUF3426 domain-containing protein [Spongiibacteraceae bacterium]
METRITQCPRCGTSFRVTDALLAVAAGAVRCGSCLHIFNAREHWLDDKKPDDKAAAPTTTSRTAPIHATEPDDDRREPTFDEDGLFDDDTALFGDEPASEEPDTGRTIFNPSDTDFVAAAGGAEESSRFDGGFLDASDWLTPNPINFGADNFSEGSTDGEEKQDESWVEDLLREDRPPKNTPVEATEKSSAELSEADRRIERLSIISDYQLEHDDILAQVPETTESASPEDIIILDLPSAYDPGLRRGAEAIETPLPEVSEPAGNPAAGNDFSAGERIGDDGVPAALRGLKSQPIRVHQFVRERRWPKLLWGLGLIIAVALLPAQYLYFNFNNLARGELRPWLAQACGLIGCQLPPQSDAARIRTGSLIVRSHPSVSGALAVDAIITNLAPFAQPYPELVLQFTDMDGKPVAGRRFQPADYLGGELTGSRLMPIGQPIHIGLEVRDPGPKAVNYLLAVSPPQS